MKEIERASDILTAKSNITTAVRKVIGTFSLCTMNLTVYDTILIHDCVLYMCVMCSCVLITIASATVAIAVVTITVPVCYFLVPL